MSVSTVRMRSSVEQLALAAMALVVVCAPGGTSAQPRVPFTGYELALSGSTQVRAGRPARFHGVAYRVRGVAELVPFEGRVRARFVRAEDDSRTPWVTAGSAADGRFEVDVPIAPMDDTPGSPRIEVEVGPADDARTFEVAVTPRPALAMMLRTDRNLYEPGEPAHVWLLLTDEATGRPVSGEDVALRIGGGPLPSGLRMIATEASGVAHVELAIPEGAPHGSVAISAEVAGQLTEQTTFDVGTRTWERILATVEVTDDQVAPQSTTTARVHVTTPSGAPVSGAAVTVQLAGTEYTGQTDDEGDARIQVVAPAYHTQDASSVVVNASVSHPAHGSIRTSTTMRLAVPRTLEVEAFARNGGLIPEIEDVLYVRLRDGAGEPPEAGTELSIEGPAVQGASRTFTTDAHGLAEIPIRVPVGAASGRSGAVETPLLVRVHGPHERVAHAVLPVHRQAELGLSLDRVVTEPGTTVTVGVARRPSAARSAVTLELRDHLGQPLEVVHLAPRRRSVRLDLPPDRLGLFSIVARTVRQDESFTGPATHAGLIVRPAGPDFVSLEPERRRWVVGETARVRLNAGAGGAQRWGAVLVRDLSAHGGEDPFRRSYLAGRFEEAILDPTTPSADRLLRAALAAHSGVGAPPREAPPLVDALGLDPAPETGARSAPLRDPFPKSRELARRGVGAAMSRIEQRLAEALDAGALDDVTTTTRGRRGFASDLLSNDGDFETLGGGAITPAMLQAADPSFDYDNVARRVARERLVRIMVALAAYLDPGDDASPAAQMASREPSERWLPRMVERGLLSATDLDDPWGGRFQLRRTRSPALVLSARATNLELVSPGPDGRPGTRDDVRDPFARAVPAGTPYALSSGEDSLMRTLAAVSPVASTLQRITEAYQRVSAEMREEEIGDAVSAEVSEDSFGLGGLGTIGHGAGGGGGSGYGRGAGGLAGRTARAPRVRMGRARVSGLAGIVRERFPPTLLFVPSLALDDSGTTEIEIPLADTVTTYLVEAIVWREDGWVWSDETRIEVDREIVVDAPIPTTAHRGDVLRLPLRISNRGEEAQRVVLRLLGDEGLGVADSEPHPLTLSGGDATVVPVEVSLDRVGEGRLTVVATSPDGEAIDAVRRPITVVELARRVSVDRKVVGDGEVVFDVDVPAGADPRGASLSVAAGPAVFGSAEPDSPWAAWSGPTADGDALRVLHDSRSPVQQAFWIGAVWDDGVTGDDEVSRQAVRVTQRLDRLVMRLERDEGRQGQSLHVEAWTLLGLAPVVAAADARDVMEPAQLVERLRRQVAEHAMAAADDPGGWVLAAAALGLSAGHGDRASATELLRRARRHTVAVGEDRWLATERRAVRSTLLWAAAELSVGRRDDALALLSTVGRWVALGNTLAADETGIATALMSRLLDGEAPTRVQVTIDGAPREVDLVGGSTTIDAPELAEPGAHRVVARSGDGALVQLSAAIRYGVGWRAEPPERGPLALAIEGEAGGVDDVAELELVVRNRSPRTLPRPVVEVELPSGAELTAEARRRIRGGARRVDVSSGVLTLSLAPMPPGREERFALPIRWSVDGRLRGLGAAGWVEDRPDGVSVLRPRTVQLEEGR